MGTLDVKTPPVRVASGKAAVQGGLDKANSAPHCATDIAQRRAASIRLQAIGQQIGGAL
jgi:hypothetical protein